MAEITRCADAGKVYCASSSVGDCRIRAGTRGVDDLIAKVDGRGCDCEVRTNCPPPERGRSGFVARVVEEGDFGGESSLEQRIKLNRDGTGRVVVSQNDTCAVISDL